MYQLGLLFVGGVVGAFITYEVMSFRAERLAWHRTWQEGVDRRRAERQQMVLEHAWRAGFVREPDESTERFIKRFIHSKDLADIIDVADQA